MPSLLLECAVRAALMAAATAALLRILRVGTAAARHAAWTGVLATMLLLPAWTAWGPKATVRLLPAANAPAAPARLASAPTDLTQSFDLQTPASPAPHRIWNWSDLAMAVYAFGVLILLARLIAGTLRAHALLRAAVKRGGRLTSSGCAAPVTIGWLRPSAILPEGWSEWPPARLAAVLTHEGAHARRRDPLVQWLALLNRALFWFHPLAWWLERRLSALAEEACDAAVLERGHDPCEYSECLLEMERSVMRNGARLHLWGMTMPGSSLPQRIRTIVEARPAPRLTRARVACTTLACLLVSAVFGAASLDREAPPLPPPPPAAASAPEAPPPAPTPAPPLEPAPSPAPQDPTRTPASEPKSKRLLVLHFDLASLGDDPRVRSMAAAEKFVRTQMGPDDAVAVMSFDGAVRVMQDFTGDKDVLLRTIRNLPAAAASPSSDNPTLTGLETAVRMLAPLPEKKALIYFSVPAPHGSGPDPQLQNLIQAAIRANVSFYPIDARGLIAAPDRQQPQEDPPPPAFEVASVKISPGAGGLGSRQDSDDPGRVSILGFTLRQLIGTAYKAQDRQISGGPGWMDSERYDIEARTGARSSPDQKSLMLRTLLAERFALKLNRETRQLQAYVLLVGKNGPKFHESDGSDLKPPAPGFLPLSGTLGNFAGLISKFVNTRSQDPLPVIDQTGLPGRYNLSLDLSFLSRGLDSGGRGPRTDEDPVDAWRAALDQQLGLRLEIRKAPVEVFVIDQAEKPSDQ